MLQTNKLPGLETGTKRKISSWLHELNDSAARSFGSCLNHQVFLFVILLFYFFLFVQTKNLNLDILVEGTNL